MINKYYIWYDDKGKGHRKRYLICKYCGRIMPTKDWRTKNGCINCDAEYWQKKQQKLALDK
jgi:hypothetical protein